TTPMGAGQKRPADLDLLFLGLIPAVPRRTNDLVRLPVHGHKSSPRLYRSFKKFLENFFFVPIMDWMLFPNHGVRSHREQTFPILRPKRAKFKEIANEVRL